PVVNYIVPKVDYVRAKWAFSCPGPASSVEPGISAIVMCYKIMVKGSISSTPNSTVAMIVLPVKRFIQAFGEHTILHGEVFIGIKGTTLVYRPAHRTMVYNNILAISAP